MHIDWTAILVAVIAFLGSTGMWTLVDHRQQRKLEKEQQESEILKEIKSVHSRIDTMSDNFDAKIKALQDTVEENEAKSRRVRILRFADEIFMDMNHSKDNFDQVLSDITDYDNYCESHPKFKNHQTEETVKYIKSVYDKRMEKKDFARYGAFRVEGYER